MWRSAREVKVIGFLEISQTSTVEGLQSYSWSSSTAVFENETNPRYLKVIDLVQFHVKSPSLRGKKGNCKSMVVPPLNCHNSQVIQVVKHDYFSQLTDDVALLMQQHASSNC